MPVAHCLCFAFTFTSLPDAFIRSNFHGMINIHLINFVGINLWCCCQHVLPIELQEQLGHSLFIALLCSHLRIVHPKMKIPAPSTHGFVSSTMYDFLYNLFWRMLVTEQIVSLHIKHSVMITPLGKEKQDMMQLNHDSTRCNVMLDLIEASGTHSKLIW